ncbi:glycosyltransferase family 4 protein [Paracoccaceae bacterium Fryx2]|nr:glycosyltransferase family 4 protein [Paracoccaceae bacterium Fryx2]
MILVVQGQLPHYRREFFNALCSLDEVTVVHSGAQTKGQGDRFSEVLLPMRVLGPFRLQQDLDQLISELRPRTVIAMFDMRWLNSVRAMFSHDRKVNWVWWGLDQGRSKTALRLKLMIARRSNPIVFYDNQTRSSFEPLLPADDRLFVANNTFHVSDRVESYLHPVKNRFINVGSLDARKQNDVTIRVLKKIRDETGESLMYTLIGDGSEKERLLDLIDSLKMAESVELVGRIEDPEKLARYYSEALASVSFGQAGLAVLQSMAFGVPFVTKKNAISGGEKNNIAHKINGIVCSDDPESLEAALRKLIESPDYARKLGKEAYQYYSREATVENMVENFERAITWRESASA